MRHLPLCTILAVLLGMTGARAETIRFGAILPLTGPGAGIGTQQMRGIQFALEKANAAGGIQGNKIELLFEDNQAKPDQSILGFNRLVDLQTVPIIFTAFSGPSLAMAPLATRKKILLVNAGAQADKLATASPYLVNTLPTIGDEIKVISKYLVADGKKQATIDAPGELAAEFKTRFGVEMEFFVRQYYNATQIILAVTDRLLAEGKPLTGENMRDMLFTIGRFQGLLPLEFKSNTATVPLDINQMRGGKDITIRQMNSE